MWIYDVTPQHEWSIQCWGLTSQHIMRAWWHVWGVYLSFPSWAPMWTTASWKIHQRKKWGLTWEVTRFNFNSAWPQASFHPGSPPVFQELHDLLTSFTSLILVFFFILEISIYVFQVVSSSKTTSSSPSLSWPQRFGFLFIHVRGESQLGVWRRYWTHVNTRCL